ncbi:MAG: YrdB family protein [Nocardioidaceae bacterium]|nr:YrdB family protein [Nocardioidaceae bacterium]NUS52078.1 YrdB family protein [Nocardioidaceae bacterium]
MTDRPRPSGGLAVLLAVRFLAELGMLAALAWGGWHLVDETLPALLLAVVLPLLAAVVWGRWVAPRATHRLHDPARAVVEGVLFFAAFVLVTRSDPATIGWALLMLLAYLISFPARRVEL